MLPAARLQTKHVRLAANGPALTTAGVQLLAAHRSIRNGDRMPKLNAGKRLKNNLHEQFTEPRRDAVRLPNERF